MRNETNSPSRVTRGAIGRFSGVVLVAALSLLPLGCERPPQPQRYSQSREIMGTLATVTAIAPSADVASLAVEAGYRRLADVNRLMSDYVEDSEIGRLNRGEPGVPVGISPETLACIAAAIRIGEASGGAFDVTCRPLVALWKQSGREKRLPTDAELASARALVGLDKIVVDAAAGTVARTQDGVQLDLGGIAKGYALDLAAKAMLDAGATSVLVDVGGDVLAVGRLPDGAPWRIGVKHPFQSGLATTLMLADRSVATSGVQQRFYEIGGKRYSHIVDPRTGMPAEQAPSVTVIGPDGMTADAWATAFSVLTVEAGQALIARGGAPGIEVMWITGDANEPVVAKTAGFDAYLAGP